MSSTPVKKVEEGTEEKGPLTRAKRVSLAISSPSRGYELRSMSPVPERTTKTRALAKEENARANSPVPDRTTRTRY